MKRKVKGSFMGMGGATIEVVTDPTVDPQIEQAARLKNRAHELLELNARIDAEDAERRRQAEDNARRLQADAAAQKQNRIDAVHKLCDQADWDTVCAIVDYKEFRSTYVGRDFTAAELASGEAYEIAYQAFRRNE